MTRTVLSAAAIAIALTVPPHAITAAKPGPRTIVDLGTLGGGFSDAFGINNDPGAIQVVGQSTRSDGFVHAFFWTAPGPMVDLGTFAGGNSFASDINNHGQIAGRSDNAAQRMAVVWTSTPGGWVVQNLGTLTGACCASANGLNNGTAGDAAAVWVVGHSTVGSGEAHAALWRASAAGWAVEDLGTLPGDVSSTAQDVNDEGVVAGMSRSPAGVFRGFAWTAAAGMVRLPGLGGETYALAIGNGGDVAGLSTAASGIRHAVRWRFTNGEWILEDLGTLGGCCSEAYGINTFGDVVGVSDFGKRSSTQHGFLTKSFGTMEDLGVLQRQSAGRDLNDFGAVVGGSGSGGQSHAVLWRRP